MSNPSASLIHEPHAFHTSPMLLTLAICGPRTFFVVPVPHMMPLKAIVVLSTSFSPLERSIVPAQAFRRTKMASASRGAGRSRSSRRSHSWLSLFVDVTRKVYRD